MKPNPQVSQGGNPWSVEEINQIEDAVRNELEFAQICALFPARTADAIRHRVRQARRTIDAANAQANPQPVSGNAQSNAQTANARAQSQPVIIQNQTPAQFAKARQPWTAEEDQTLNNAVQNHFDFAQIRALFPDRSAPGVKRRYERIANEAKSTTVNKSKGRYQHSSWTSEDDEKIRDAVRTNLQRDQIRAMFPNRTADAVRHKVNRTTQALQGEEQSQPPPPQDSLPIGLGRGIHADADLYEDADLDLYAEPSNPEDDVLPGPSQRRTPQGQPPRSSSRAENEYGEFLMSGALLVSDSEALPQAREGSSDSSRSVVSWRAQSIEGLPRTSTPPRPEVEPLTPPANEDWRDAIGGPIPADWPYPEDSGWDLGFSLHAEPDENDDVINLGQVRRRHHPALPQGSLAQDNLHVPVVPSVFLPEAPVDDGYSRYMLSVYEHPDLRDGLDFTPTPHHPYTPAGFVTSEQLFADSSVAPSAFMPPSSVDEDVVMEEAQDVDGDEMME